MPGGASLLTCIFVAMEKVLLLDPLRFSEFAKFLKESNLEVFLRDAQFDYTVLVPNNK